MTPCTLWYRHDRDGTPGYNHLEDEHATADTPTVRCAAQNGWMRATWTKRHAWLTSDVPAKIMELA